MELLKHELKYTGSVISRMVDVFLDSSVVIAACGSLTGASNAIIRLAEIGMIRIHIIPYVADEIERNLKKRLRRGLPAFTRLLSNSNFVINDDPSPQQSQIWENVIEENDAPIIAAAVAINADYLLSLNTKDFTSTVSEACGILIMTPSQFIQLSRHVLNIGLKRS